MNPNPAKDMSGGLARTARRMLNNSPLSPFQREVQPSIYKILRTNLHDSNVESKLSRERSSTSRALGEGPIVDDLRFDNDFFFGAKSADGNPFFDH